MKDILKNTHKPFDFVESKKGSIGFITEVSISECQDGFNDIVDYSVIWIKNIDNEPNSWWKHSSLNVIGNMFNEIAKCTVHPFGGNEKYIDELM